MIFVFGGWAFVRALLVNSAAVSLENVALRHQLAVLQRSVRRPRLRRRDRIFWLWLAPSVGGLAEQPPHRQACDRPRLAPPGLPTLLALEVPVPLSGSSSARP
jgi:hypothetical protein